MQRTRTTDPSDLKSALVLLPLLVCLGFIQYSSDSVVRTTLSVPDIGSLGDDPPYYYLREEFVEGVSSGTAALAGFVVAALSWKRWQPYSGMLLWLTWLWHMPKFFDSLVIYLRCPHLLDVNNAVSAWKTFDEALDDPLRKAVFIGTLVSGMLLAWFANHRWRRMQTVDIAAATSVG